MCDCFDLADFICVFTFFITAIVALLFVQYFLIYLDTETDEKAKMFLSIRCSYFLLLTFLGCLVFAGIQRRSICLLKWPSRLLTTLLSVGLITLTVYLWTLDRVHKNYVWDLEGKTLKLSVVTSLLLVYILGVQKLICRIGNTGSPIAVQGQRQRQSNATFIFEQSNQQNHPNLVEVFRSKKETNKAESSSSARRINEASNGVNYYELLLEGSSATSSCASTKKQHYYYALSKNGLFGSSGGTTGSSNENGISRSFSFSSSTISEV